MLRRMFRVLPLLFLLCAAGAARAQASGPCERKPPSDPAYYADMKEMPPGKYNFSYVFDKAQVEDASAPAAVRFMVGITSTKQRSGKISCVEIENRTARAVKAVQLRWAMTARAADGSIVENGEVLAKGLLPTVFAEIEAGGRRKVELHGAHFADFLQPLAWAGEIKGAYHLTVGVARLEFTDGTALDLP